MSDTPHLALAPEAGLDAGHWAFGHGPTPEADDPLAGVDTRVPDGVDEAVLAAYCLGLGDDALVLAQRLSGWASRAPDLEDDVALANIALDLLGQARLLLARAAAADPASVPRLPEGSPVPAEDALAFFRDAGEFRNARLAEQENGDFAATVVRLLVLSTHRLALLRALAGDPSVEPVETTARTGSCDPVLAAVAARGVKEVTYHAGWAGRWCVVLAGGTDESRRRVTAALALVAPWRAELFETTPVERAAVEQGVGPDPAALAPEADRLLD